MSIELMVVLAELFFMVFGFIVIVRAVWRLIVKGCKRILNCGNSVIDRVKSR